MTLSSSEWNKSSGSDVPMIVFWYMSLTPLCTTLKATRDPSRDQTAKSSSSGLNVNLEEPPLTRSNSHRSFVLIFGSSRETITFFSSGDNAGFE